MIDYRTNRLHSSTSGMIVIADTNPTTGRVQDLHRYRTEWSIDPQHRANAPDYSQLEINVIARLLVQS